MAYLIVREPGRMPFSLPLRGGFTIGRDADCDLVLADRHASRKHARFTAVDGAYQLADLGSTHGTLVNRQPSLELRLADGDLIQVGHVLLVFHEGDDAGDDAVMCSVTPGSGTRASGDDARRLQLLYDVSGALEASDDVVARMLEATLDVLACARGLVTLIEGGVERRITRGRGAEGDDIALSRAILARVQRGESVLWRVGLSDAATAARQGVQSAMAAPLALPDRPLGYVYVDDLERADRFQPAELDFLTALARLFAVALAKAEERRRADAVVQALRENDPLPELIGDSARMRVLEQHLRKFAAADGTAVLIRGESGTGKELVARTIHALSPRAGGPFVCVNCAAIPDNLIESELFGHEKGAFTDALRARRGKFALADGGTLFLDEIGDLSLVAQAKVLRAIQEGEVQALGSDRVQRVDLRILSATHKPLEDEIAAGRFRADLYYRLALGEIDVPSLRERGEDVVVLAQAFLARAARRLRRRVSGFTPEALEVLRGYGWPGNVRQLQNEVERALILAEGPVLDVADLGARLGRGLAAPREATLAERFTKLDVLERELVEEALAKAQGNGSEAARLLGISRMMIRRRLTRFGLGKDE